MSAALVAPMRVMVKTPLAPPSTAVEVVAAMVTVLRSLSLRVDGIPRPLALVGSAFPSAAELKTGTAVIQLEYESAALGFAAGRHRLEYQNHWEPVRSVYLANALMPATRAIHVIAQRRSTNQSELVVVLDVDGRTAAQREQFPDDGRRCSLPLNPALVAASRQSAAVSIGK